MPETLGASQLIRPQSQPPVAAFRLPAGMRNQLGPKERTDGRQPL